MKQVIERCDICKKIWTGGPRREYCKGCFYIVNDGGSPKCPSMSCCWDERKDGQNVIFKRKEKV